jgi:hypothetical protein
MREWIETQLKAGLPALAGSRIAGTVAVKQELINEALATWLTSGALSGAGSLPDLAPIKHVVKAATVRAETGTLLVDFTIEI